MGLDCGRDLDGDLDEALDEAFDVIHGLTRQQRQRDEIEFDVRRVLQKDTIP